MEKVTVIKASEQEIVSLIQKHISEKFDSIVAAEEIGNQDWTVTVNMPDSFEEETVQEVIDGKNWGQYRTREIMCVLHRMGHLDAGDYIVDCTW